MRDKVIRFGGREIEGRFHFEFSGGALALDFVNTRDERPRGGLERLISYQRLLDWTAQVGLADERKVAALAELAQIMPVEADRALADALTLREASFAVLAARVNREMPADEELSAVNRWIEQAGTHRSLVIRGNQLAWQDYTHLNRLDFMLPAIAMSLADILVETDLSSRLRLCASADCDWAFLDRTRRRNRVWCDMSVCGNRAKARRHYERLSGSDLSEPR